MAKSLTGTTWQALYNDHHLWLLGWLRQRLGCAWEAADLTQDTFVRVISRDDPNQIREPRAYLLTIARGLLVNHVRRKDLERAYLDALARLPASLAPDTETAAIWLETLLEIDAMLDGLPARVRRAFLLSQLDGLTYAQIAVQLDVSVSSVKQYMRKALMHCLQTAA